MLVFKGNTDLFSLSYSDGNNINQKVLHYSKDIPIVYLGNLKNLKLTDTTTSFYSEEKVERMALFATHIDVLSDKEVVIKMEDIKNTVLLTLNIKEDSGRVSIFLKCNNKDYNKIWLYVTSHRDRNFYGGGQKFFRANMSWEKNRIWTSAKQNQNKISKKMTRNLALHGAKKNRYLYSAFGSEYLQPTYTTDDMGYLHIDTGGYVEFDFSPIHWTSIMVAEIPRVIHLGFYDSYDNMFRNLSDLLGTQPLPPTWLNEGVILSLSGGEESILKRLLNTTKNNIKVSAVYIPDWAGSKNRIMTSLSPDKNLYSDLEETILKIKQTGSRSIAYLSPYIKVGSPLYKEGARKGFFVKNAQDKPLLVYKKGLLAILDLTDELAAAWYKDLIIKNIVGLGFSGWIADGGALLPKNSHLSNKADLRQFKNKWTALWSVFNHDVISSLENPSQYFFTTCAGSTQTISNSPMMWSGERHCDFSVVEGLRSFIPSALSLSMSGFGLTHSEIGGETDMIGLRRTKELLKRWTEMATFTPLMRVGESFNPKKNLQFDSDQDLLDHFSRMSGVHAMLRPYINHLIIRNSEEGIPAFRPTFLHARNTNLVNNEEAYLFGEDLLCAPVLKEGVEGWKVRFPTDNWIGLWDGMRYGQGSEIVSAPLGYPPVFYRKSSDYSSLFKKITKKFGFLDRKELEEKS